MPSRMGGAHLKSTVKLVRSLLVKQKINRLKEDLLLPSFKSPKSTCQAPSHLLCIFGSLSFRKRSRTSVVLSFVPHYNKRREESYMHQPLKGDALEMKWGRWCQWYLDTDTHLPIDPL